MMDRIPVYDPSKMLGDTERANLLAAFDSGVISGSGGRFIAEFEDRFADYCGCKFGVACSSGSTALHLAMRVAGIKPGNEVLVSALTNIATANAVVSCGATVVPIDSEPDTWNMDPSLIEKAITKKTRAIIPVHIYGHPVAMDVIYDVADRYDLIVVEDAAEAHGAKIGDRMAGSFGDMACFSYYSNKTLCCGEGGMVVTNSDEFADHLCSLRNLAFTEPRFFHLEVGYNYRMTNLQAAIGCAQLDKIELIIEMKRDLARRYTERLKDVPGLRLPVEREGCRNVYWMYCIVLEPEFGCTRNDLMERLADENIETRTMFCPMNLQPALYDIHLVKEVPCPVAENLWQCGMYLPSTPTLRDDELDRICDVIKEAA